MEKHLIHWSDLIQEALISIFSRLDFDSLVAARQACPSWRAAAMNPECWDSVHMTLHQKFLDRLITGDGPLDVEKLNSQSLYLMAYGGAGTKSICLDSVATDKMLQLISTRFPFLESLSLRNCNRISNTAFCDVIRSCKSLKFIDVSFCDGVMMESSIEEIGKCCSNLVGLNLAHMQVTEEMAVAIGEFLPKLKWVNLSNTPITINGLCSILHLCNELQYLNVMRCSRLDMDKELMDMATNIAEFKSSSLEEDYFEYDDSYLEKCLLKWYP